MSSPSLMLPLIDNIQEFFTLRQKLLAQPSIQQTICMKSASKVQIITHTPGNQTTTVPIIETTVKQKNDEKYKNQIFIHCFHEARFIKLKRNIHEIHNSIFKKEDHGNIRLVVGNSNNPNLDFELAHKRPRSTLVKDPLKSSKY